MGRNPNSKIGPGHTNWSPQMVMSLYAKQISAIENKSLIYTALRKLSMFLHKRLERHDAWISPDALAARMDGTTLKLRCGCLRLEVNANGSMPNYYIYNMTRFLVQREYLIFQNKYVGTRSVPPPIIRDAITFHEETSERYFADSEALDVDIESMDFETPPPMPFTVPPLNKSEFLQAVSDMPRDKVDEAVARGTYNMFTINPRAFMGHLDLKFGEPLLLMRRN